MIVFNTASKLADRTLNMLEDLNVNQIESSFRNKNVNTNILCVSRNVTGFNDFNSLGNKDLNRMTKLLVHVIEKSKRNKTIRSKAIIIKPRKIYSATLRLNKTYSNVIKY